EPASDGGQAVGGSQDRRIRLSRRFRRHEVRSYAPGSIHDRRCRSSHRGLDVYVARGSARPRAHRSRTRQMRIGCRFREAEMKRLVVAIAMAAGAWTFAAAQAERLDYAAIGRIRDEGMARSQVMEIVSWLSDVYG